MLERWPEETKSLLACSTIKAAQNVINNCSKSSLPVICPNNPSSPHFFPLLCPSKLHKMTSKSGQCFTTTKTHNRLSIKYLLLCVLRSLLQDNAKMMQNKLVSTEHNIG